MRKSTQLQAIRRGSLARAGQKIFSFMITTLAVIGIVMGLRLFDSGTPKTIKIAEPLQMPAAPTVRAPIHTPTRDPNRPLVGIVSGHRGYDPGAVCADGLTEANINYSVASEVVDLLARRGVQADLLNEYDDLLTDYQANALVSIHSDSCNIPGATGFKVARVTNSAISEAEDQLVACLYKEYATHTDLPEHPASITDNMTNYHAFSEIHPFTPGAIIEMGFMLDDRFLLQHKPKVLARGIAAGILCFLGRWEGTAAP